MSSKSCRITGNWGTSGDYNEIVTEFAYLQEYLDSGSINDDDRDATKKAVEKFEYVSVDDQLPPYSAEKEKYDLPKMTQNYWIQVLGLACASCRE